MPSTLHARLAALLAAAATATACSTIGTQQPLYLQLGGEAGISIVSSRLIDRVSTDPRTSRSFGKMKIDYLKKSVAAYLCKVADAGSLLGMDRFGLDVLLPFEDRIATVLELLRRGYAERMVLAHDASCFIDWFDPEAKRQVVPRWNYRHISQDVLPALL